MSSADTDAGIDAAVAAAKVAAGLDPSQMYAPIEFEDHLDGRYVRAFWHRQARRALDTMLAESAPVHGAES